LPHACEFLNEYSIEVTVGELAFERLRLPTKQCIEKVVEDEVMRYLYANAPNRIAELQKPRQLL
jgi:hypothetical protein